MSRIIDGIEYMTFDEWLDENGYYSKDELICKGFDEDEIDELRQEFEDYCYETGIEAADDVDFYR